MIHRSIEDNIRKALDGKKAVTIMGARQVGKSTLTEALFSGEENVLFLDGDEADVRAILKDATSTRLRAIFGKATTVVIDEAQKIDDIGNVLKLVTDKMKDTNPSPVASESSNFSRFLSKSWWMIPVCWNKRASCLNAFFTAIIRKW